MSCLSFSTEKTSVYYISSVMTVFFSSAYMFTLKHWLDFTNCSIYKLIFIIPINKIQTFLLNRHNPENKQSSIQRLKCNPYDVTISNFHFTMLRPVPVIEMVATLACRDSMTRYHIIRASIDCQQTMLKRY